MVAGLQLSTVAIVLVAVLVWVGCALYTAGTARNNGGSYGLWLLVGFITGPLGLVFGMVYFGLTGERHRRVRAGIGEKSDIARVERCPGCHELVPVTYESCQFCGTPLSKGKSERRR
jgi:uncharacterized membrane protein